MDYFDSLPVEITLEILVHLSTEWVLNCKLVSKTWRNHVLLPLFSKMHSHHLNNPSVADYDSGKLGFLVCTYSDDRLQYFEYNENHKSSPIQRIRRLNLASPLRKTSFIDSCNGLICLAEYRSVYICNPISREYVLVPEIMRDSCDIEMITEKNHFGYVSSTNKYKVLKVCLLNNELIEIYIYTLGSGNGWRNLGKFNYQSASETFLRRGLFTNGALYWLDRKVRMIITLDFAQEKFCEHLSPPPLAPSLTNWHWCFISLGVLDGFLSLTVCSDIWLLKKKNGKTKEGEEHQSFGWSKEFRFRDVENKLLAVTKSDGVLNYSRYYLNICNTETSTSKSLVKFKNRLSRVTPHKNTLVSLKELGEEDTKRMESADIEEINSYDYLQEDVDPDYIYL